MKQISGLRAAGMILLVLASAMPQKAVAAPLDNVRIQSIKIISEPSIYFADPAKCAQPIQFEVTLSDFSIPPAVPLGSIYVPSDSKLALQLNIPFSTETDRATATINPAASIDSLIFDYYPRPGDLSANLAWRSTWASEATPKCPFINIDYTVVIWPTGIPYPFCLTAEQLTFDGVSPFDYTALPADPTVVQGIDIQFTREFSFDPSIEDPVYPGLFPVTITTHGGALPWAETQTRDLRLWATDTAGNPLTDVTFKTSATSEAEAVGTLRATGGQSIDQRFYVNMPEAYLDQTVQLRLGLDDAAEPAYATCKLDVITDLLFDGGYFPREFDTNLIVTPGSLTFEQDAPAASLSLTYTHSLVTNSRLGIIFPTPLSAEDTAAGYVPADSILTFGSGVTADYFTFFMEQSTSIPVAPLPGAYGLTKVRIAFAGKETTCYKDVMVEILKEELTLSVVWEDPEDSTALIERTSLATWPARRAKLILSRPSERTLNFNLYAYDGALPATITPPAAPSTIFMMTDTPSATPPASHILSVSVSAGMTNSACFYVHGLDDKTDRSIGTGSATGYIYPVKASAFDTNEYDSRALTVTVENKAPTIISSFPFPGATYYSGTAVPFSFVVEDSICDTLTYTVTFGDGQIHSGTLLKANRVNYQELITIAHTYTTPGEYTWTLTLWDDSNFHAAPLSHTIIIAAPTGQTQNAPVAVPHAWLKAHYPALQSAADYEAAALADSTGKGMKVWQEYVLGTDPTDPASRFTLNLNLEGGVPNVTWEPAVPGRTYTLKGKRALSDAEWETVENSAEYRFFRVSVDLE